MEVASVDGTRLTWEVGGRAATLAAARDGGGPHVTLRFTADEPARVRVGLILLSGRREIDVSIQPSLVERVLSAASGTVRQFLAIHNRPVPRGDAAAVAQHLVRAGVLHADHPHNRLWLGDA